MKKLLYGLLTIILVSAGLVACAPEVAPTPTPIPTPTPTPTPAPEKPYYEGKTITIIASASPGGGTDMCARVTAQSIPKYIPGNPQIIVSNQSGAGGTVAHNERVSPGFLTSHIPQPFGTFQRSRESGCLLAFDTHKEFRIILCCVGHEGRRTGGRLVLRGKSFSHSCPFTGASAGTHRHVYSSFGDHAERASIP